MSSTVSILCLLQIFTVNMTWSLAYLLFIYILSVTLSISCHCIYFRHLASTSSIYCWVTWSLCQGILLTHVHFIVQAPSTCHDAYIPINLAADTPTTVITLPSTSTPLPQSTWQAALIKLRCQNHGLITWGNCWFRYHRLIN